MGLIARLRRRRRFRRLYAEHVHLEREHLKWMSFAVAGMFDMGNRHLVDLAVSGLPTDDPVLEIGAFAGASTNVLAYFLRRYERANDLITTDPWVFEGEQPDRLPESAISFEAYRGRVREQFEENVRFWSRDRLPYAFELASDDFFARWREGKIVVDLFGRERQLGGPLAFCYVDGSHAYDQVRRDFLNADQLLVPGGFLLFDDSNEFGPFPDVHRVAREARERHGYELVKANPHHLLRKTA
jgi:SAM-dependent methyltransferase